MLTSHPLSLCFDFLIFSSLYFYFVLSVFVCLYFVLALHCLFVLFVCLFVCLFVWLFVCLFLFKVQNRPNLHDNLFVCLSVCYFCKSELETAGVYFSESNVGLLLYMRLFFITARYTVQYKIVNKYSDHELWTWCSRRYAIIM